MFQAVGFGEVCQRLILQSTQSWRKLCLVWELCHLPECCPLFADWIGFSSEALGASLLLSLCCKLQAPAIMADL